VTRFGTHTYYFRAEIKNEKPVLRVEERASSLFRSRDLNGSNALRFGTLLSFGRFKFYCLAVFEIPETIPDDAREVYEEILATFVRSNEAIALLLTEPLYRALSQFAFSSRLSNSPVGVKSSIIAAFNPSPVVSRDSSLTRVVCFLISFVVYRLFSMVIVSRSFSDDRRHANLRAVVCRQQCSRKSSTKGK
jgi:hypothetical protein